MISLATETERTLFFDFLPLSLGEIRGFKTRFHLYTVPGQVFYDASRKLILKGVDGVVFVADSQIERMEANLESLENLRTNLAEQGYSLDKIPYVIQYNKRDLPNAVPVEELRKLLNPRNVPEFEAVAPTGRRRVRHAQGGRQAGADRAAKGRLVRGLRGGSRSASGPALDALMRCSRAPDCDPTGVDCRRSLRRLLRCCRQLRGSAGAPPPLPTRHAARGPEARRDRAAAPGHRGRGVQHPGEDARGAGRRPEGEDLPHQGAPAAAAGDGARRRPLHRRPRGALPQERDGRRRSCWSRWPTRSTARPSSPRWTSNGDLDKREEFEIFNGRIVPGQHQIAVRLVYRGHGYGVFSYLEGYKFKVQSSYTFNAEAGKVTTVKVVGYEKGGITTDLKDRPGGPLRRRRATRGRRPTQEGSATRAPGRRQAGSPKRAARRRLALCGGRCSRSPALRPSRRRRRRTQLRATREQDRGPRSPRTSWPPSWRRAHARGRAELRRERRCSGASPTVRSSTCSATTRTPRSSSTTCSRTRRFRRKRQLADALFYLADSLYQQQQLPRRAPPTSASSSRGGERPTRRGAGALPRGSAGSRLITSFEGIEPSTSQAGARPPGGAPPELALRLRASGCSGPTAGPAARASGCSRSTRAFAAVGAPYSRCRPPTSSACGACRPATSTDAAERFERPASADARATRAKTRRSRRPGQPRRSAGCCTRPATTTTRVDRYQQIAQRLAELRRLALRDRLDPRAEGGLEQAKNATDSCSGRAGLDRSRPRRRSSRGTCCSSWASTTRPPRPTTRSSTPTRRCATRSTPCSPCRRTRSATSTSCSRRNEQDRRRHLAPPAAAAEVGHHPAGGRRGPELMQRPGGRAPRRRAEPRPSSDGSLRPLDERGIEAFPALQEGYTRAEAVDNALTRAEGQAAEPAAVEAAQDALCAEAQAELDQGPGRAAGAGGAPRLAAPTTEREVDARQDQLAGAHGPGWTGRPFKLGYELQGARRRASPAIRGGWSDTATRPGASAGGREGFPPSCASSAPRWWPATRSRLEGAPAGDRARPRRRGLGARRWTRRRRLRTGSTATLAGAGAHAARRTRGRLVRRAAQTRLERAWARRRAARRGQRAGPRGRPPRSSGGRGPPPRREGVREKLQRRAAARYEQAPRSIACPATRATWSAASPSTASARAPAVLRPGAQGRRGRSWTWPVTRKQDKTRQIQKLSAAEGPRAERAGRRVQGSAQGRGLSIGHGLRPASSPPPALAAGAGPATASGKAPARPGAADAGRAAARPAPSRAAAATAPRSSRAVEEISRRSQRYEEESQATSAGEVQLLVEKKYEEKRNTLAASYEKAIRDLEVLERKERLDAIARFEEFLSRYPDDPRYTPDVMFRLAELYYERARDDHVAGDGQHVRGRRRAALAEERGAAARAACDFAPSIALYRALIAGSSPTTSSTTAPTTCSATAWRSRTSSRRRRPPTATLIARYPKRRFVPEAWVRIGEYYFDAVQADALPAAAEAYEAASRPPGPPALRQGALQAGLDLLPHGPLRATRWTASSRSLDYYVARRPRTGEKPAATCATRRSSTPPSASPTRSGASLAKAQELFQRLGGRPTRPRSTAAWATSTSTRPSTPRPSRPTGWCCRRTRCSPTRPQIQQKIVQAYERDRKLRRGRPPRRETLARDLRAGHPWYEKQQGRPGPAGAVRELWRRRASTRRQSTTTSRRSRYKQEGKFARRRWPSSTSPPRPTASYFSRFPRSKQAYEVQFYFAECLYNSFQFEHGRRDLRGRCATRRRTTSTWRDAAFSAVLAGRSRSPG